MAKNTGLHATTAPTPYIVMPTPPWKKPAPKRKSSTKLTPENLAWAKAAAKKASRRYPNLVDNMAASRRQTEQEAKASSPKKREGP